jgi:hypothetical protein
MVNEGNLQVGTKTYQLDVSNSSFLNEITQTLLGGSYNSSGQTGALQSYAPRLYKNNGTGPNPGFSGCSTNPCGLTAIVGATYFVIFNHDANTSATHSATVVDSLQPSGSIEPAAPLPEPVAETPLEHRAMHWHFPLPRTQLELLKP